MVKEVDNLVSCSLYYFLSYDSLPVLEAATVTQ